MLTLLKRQNTWGKPLCQFSLLGNGLSIRVLLLSFFVSLSLRPKDVPPSAPAGTALPLWLITIALAVAVLITLADVRAPVDKYCGDLLAVQPRATPWAMTPITADGSAVPHAIPPWVIAGRRDRHQGGGHRAHLTLYVLHVRRVCAVRAVAVWT